MKTNKNPHKFIKDKNTLKTLSTLRRLDKDGYMYFMENYIDYASDKNIIDWIHNFEQKCKKWIKTKFVDACSAFCTLDFKGTMLTGRAYDFGHRLLDGTNTGLNLMMHTAKNPKKGIKYETICCTDASLSAKSMKIASKLKNGSLDDGKTDLSFLKFTPYFVTDGINEKGLTASILLLPLDECITKPKVEKNAFTLVKSKCKQQASVSRIVRMILDNCKTVKEAEDMLKKVWGLRFLGNNSHIFVTDATGESKLFEWYISSEHSNVQKFISIKTNAVTNFYQSHSYMPKGMPELVNLKNNYNYGYSKDGCYRNTYDRFNIIASALDFYTLSKAKPGQLVQAVMKRQTADAIVRAIALYPAPSSKTHQTQYSHIWDSKALTQTTYSFANLDESWTYSLKQHKFIK